MKQLFEDYQRLGLSKEVAAFFACFPKCGYLIIGVKNDKGELTQYWDGDCFMSIMEHMIPYPRRYLTLDRANKSLNKLKTSPFWSKFLATEKLEVLLWITPEHEWDQIPLARYKQMSQGSRFPGRPSQ